MAPSGRTITAATTSTKAATRTKTTRRTTTRRRRRIRHPRRTNFKKQQQNKVNKKQEEINTVLPSVSSQDSSKEGEMDHIAEVIDDVSNNNSACSTPKGQKFRIPEISTCPPAPKKPRVLSNCSLRRSPLSFFAPPDLELFFFSALRDVSV